MTREEMIELVSAEMNYWDHESRGVSKIRLSELFSEVAAMLKADGEEIKLQDIQIDRNDVQITKLDAENQRLREALKEMQEIALKYDFYMDHDIAWKCSEALKEDKKND